MKNHLIKLGVALFILTNLSGCSSKEKSATGSSESSTTKNSDTSTIEKNSVIESSSSPELVLNKDDIYGKQFKGYTTDPLSEITFSFADSKFDFMDGDILSYYRNITEADYEYERTKGVQFENMNIEINKNNYIVKSYNAGTETIHTFKKIDESTIAWISDGKEIILRTVDTPDQKESSKEITTEDLMVDYPAWTLESGITPATYNLERQAEANRRLAKNGLDEDNEFINRNPIVIDRETEREIHKMVGNLDYTPVESNTVINGVIVKE